MIIALYYYVTRIEAHRVSLLGNSNTHQGTASNSYNGTINNQQEVPPPAAIPAAASESTTSGLP